MRFIVALLTLFVCLTYAAAQDASFTVSVNGVEYRVQGSTITDRNSNPPPTAVILRKAALTAQILDQQILHSELSHQLFDAANRAIVFSDEQSDHFVEPWEAAIVKRSGR